MTYGMVMRVTIPLHPIARDYHLGDIRNNVQLLLDAFGLVGLRVKISFYVVFGPIQNRAMLICSGCSSSNIESAKAVAQQSIAAFARIVARVNGGNIECMTGTVQECETYRKNAVQCASPLRVVKHLREPMRSY